METEEQRDDTHVEQHGDGDVNVTVEKPDEGQQDEGNDEQGNDQPDE